ncbi:hypothetical protein L1049_010058 [Liquidambar formosana]|uniref:Uncharacterized protein n=1 Tax=Liquidambar formosana TaxID=63359 RepID=A0AAP0R1F9_LIQFO
MAEALTAFFLRKLGDQLIQEGEILSGVQEDIEWIKRELQAMVAFLKDADRRQQKEDRIKTWVGEVRDLVYDAEDIIDEFVIQMDAHRWNIFKYFQVRHRVSTRIKKIKRDVKEIKGRRDRYGFHVVQENAPPTSSCSSSRGPGATSPFIQEDDIVGIEDDVEQISKLLLERESRQAGDFSVWYGWFGEKLKARFDCHSWVFVSQSSDSRDVLRNVLFGFKASKGEPALDVMDAMDEGRLQERTYHYLQDKEYLLVLDDVWDARVWEELKHALPRERGQILLTTRVTTASPVEENTYVYNLQPLSDELAWGIFCKKAFRGKKTCPEDLKEFAEAIVRRCGGLPLAIVAIGGLLLSKNTNLPEWQFVLNTLDWELNHSSDLERLNTTVVVELQSPSILPEVLFLIYCSVP